VRLLIAALLTVVALISLSSVASGVFASPSAWAGAVCADYANQAAAQRAADTVDADGDGIYCESLPCPCFKPAQSGENPASAPTPKPSKPRCSRPSRVQSISFSKTKYPNIKRHAEAAIKAGWPRTLVLNRPGADSRRDRVLEDVKTRAGYDRDEYPPAIGRGKGKGLVRGSNPRGWRADVAYVPSSENRSHGSTLGVKLRRFCDGTKFRYVFY